MPAEKAEGAWRYLVGELVRAEAGPAELRVLLRMPAAQARASAPENQPSWPPGFQGSILNRLFPIFWAVPPTIFWAVRHCPCPMCLVLINPSRTYHPTKWAAGNLVASCRLAAREGGGGANTIQKGQ